ncbi:MAG: hypothetical protein ACKVOU_03440 [Cytophagales bacterium]
MKLFLTYLFGTVLIFGGIAHFLKPEVYFPFIPIFLPKLACVYLSGFVEIALGTGVFIRKFKHRATLGILLLMIAFLPLHIVDVFKENPAIGSHLLAIIRVPVQFLLIYWAFYIHKFK